MKMTTKASQERITKDLLDQMLEGDDPSKLFHLGQLFTELQSKLA